MKIIQKIDNGIKSVENLNHGNETVEMIRSGKGEIEFFLKLLYRNLSGRVR